MLWVPPKDWEGQDAYLIGGGSTLKRFNFDSLKGLNTIGINDAYMLGEDVVKYCLFGDASWFHKNSAAIASFKNPLVSCAPSLEQVTTDAVLSVHRRSIGIHDGGFIGWNFSTGAAAINLAMNMGAHRIYLLGFDMRAHNGKTHWHSKNPLPTRDTVFARFLRGFKIISENLIRYPHVQVIHVNTDHTLLPFFQHMAPMEFAVHIKSKRPELEPCLLH